MKKIFYTPLLFKVTLLFVLFFGGISFEGKAQEVLTEHRNSVKVMLDRAILDIAKIASEAIINSSKTIKPNEKAANIASIKYQDWEAFKNSTAKYGTIKSGVVDKYKTVEWTYDISKDSTSIKNYIKELISNNSIKEQESKLDEILKLATEKARNLITTFENTENPIMQNSEGETKQDIVFTLEQSDSLESIIEKKIENNNKFASKNLFPILNDYQEYALLASLGLGLLNFLILLYLWNTISSLRKDVKSNKYTKRESSPNKANENYITTKMLDEKIAKSNEEILRKVEEFQQKQNSQNSQPKKYKSPVERQTETQTQAYVPISSQETNTREVKHAKYPFVENGFPSNSLKTQNDDEAVYIISINGNHATFEVNQNNLGAMQRAMNDTTSFLSKACEFLDVPQNGKKPQTESKGELQLIDNVWHITQKAKIKFV